MRDVYAAAERVHVWLGCSAENSEIGIRILEDLCQDHGGNRLRCWGRLPPKSVRDGFEDVMNREWFRRVWVVQEVAVAREVVL